MAIDLHHGRQVRHLDRLLDRSHLAERPLVAPGRGAASGPGRRPTRSRATASSGPSRPWPTPGTASWRERLNRQLERISRYYGDLRAEVEEQAQQARGPRRRPRPVHRAARGPRPRGAAPRRRAAAEEPVEGPPAAAQPARDPSAQAAHPHAAVTASARDRSRGRPAGVGVGPARRGRRGRRLPRSVAIPPSSSAVTRQGELVCTACTAAKPPARR